MHHSKLAAGCPIQAMGSAEGAVDAPPGTDAVTVVDRLAAQSVRAFRERMRVPRLDGR